MFLIDISLMYLLQRPNQRFCGGQTFIEKVGTWSKFRIKLSDRHSLKGQRIEMGREHKPNSKRKIWFSVQDLAKPIICYQVDSFWLARDWFCKHQPICVWGRGMTRLGEVGKKWAWQSWKAASAIPWPDPSVCPGQPRVSSSKPNVAFGIVSAHRIGKNYEEDWCRSDREASWYLELLIPKLLQVIKLKKSVVEKVQFSILTNLKLIF